MYKVFIENREVNFSQAITLPDGISLKNDEVRTFKKWLLPLILKRKEGAIINVICEDLEKDMAIFFKDHKAISAAGGIVEREEELLFIRRHGLWDLPKGKIEKGESIEEAAIREVEEECGIQGITIKEELIETYHTYEVGKKKFSHNVKSGVDQKVSKTCRSVVLQPSQVAKIGNSILERVRVITSYVKMFDNQLVLIREFQCLN